MYEILLFKEGKGKMLRKEAEKDTPHFAETRPHYAALVGLGLAI